MFIRFALLILLMFSVFFTTFLPLRKEAFAIALPISLRETHRTIILGKIYPNRELTPLQRQRLQGLRQRRNRDIQAVLDTFQEEQLQRYLRHGESFETAIDKVKLSHEQREMVKALGYIYHLKLKALKYPGFE